MKIRNSGCFGNSHHDLIEDGQAWINMLEDRNLMAHVYDESKAQTAVEHIMKQYASAINQVFELLKDKH